MFGTGHSLALHVQSSNYPRFAVNPGNGDPFLDEMGSNAELQTNTLYTGTEHESRLILPVYTPAV